MPDDPVAVLTDAFMNQSEAAQRIFAECTAYDEGHRNAIRNQLSALAEQAEAQVRRSAKTTAMLASGCGARERHHGDLLLASVLRALLV
jgi:hypothetical protein